jgi:Protein of unknown function (DUF4242)
MPRYLIVRTFDVAQEEMPRKGRASRALTENEFPEIVWEHSHVVVDNEGKVRTFCVYQAPDEDALLAHSAQLGMHSIESIDEIAGDVTPADFPSA